MTPEAETPTYNPNAGQTEAEEAVPFLDRKGMWPKKWRWRISLIFLVILLALGTAAWLTKDEIASNLIEDTLAQYDLDASYEILAIGPEQQIIGNLKVGDETAPDFTADQIIVNIDYTLGLPQIGQIELVNPRLYGTYLNGQLSFGTLDKVLFAPGEEPPGLPEYDVRLVDARALIESDYGAIGAKLEGQGRLDDGFAGKLAVTAPDLAFAECGIESATLYGDLTTKDGDGSFDGPVRLQNAQCRDARLANADIATRLTLPADFSTLGGEFVIDAQTLAFAGANMEALTGEFLLSASLSEENAGDFRLGHSLEAQAVSYSDIELATLSLDGDLRSLKQFDQMNWDGDIGGEGLKLGLGSAGGLSSLREGVEGTLLAPLLDKLEAGLSRQLRAGSLAANSTVRVNEGVATVLVPEASVRSTNGETVLSLSRVSYSSGTNRLSGNILTGGADLPYISGRMEQVLGGQLALKLAMQEYRSGDNWLAVPSMEVRQDASGRASFSGQLKAGGAIPNGSVRDLSVPIAGQWDRNNGLAIGQRCTTVSYSSLTLSEVSLGKRAINLCPVEGEALVRYRDALQIGAQTGALDLSGEISGSPLHLAASKTVLRYPGAFEVQGMDVVIGPPENSVRLAAEQFVGNLSDEISGQFSGGFAAIDAVPMDLSELAGDWSFAEGVVSLDEGQFILTDRFDPAVSDGPRFAPLAGQSAQLALNGSDIDASAELRHPATGNLVSLISINHNLTASSGHADLNVPSLRFYDGFQPGDLSNIVAGMIALARGEITGSGRVAWDEQNITSTGVFETEDFDFAAAFGPVKGLSGRIEFTDLLNFTTAENQVVTIASVDPGVEALDGRIVYSISGGDNYTLNVVDGRWPFMGGELILRPTRAVFGEKTGQDYVFEMIALDAATFIAQMEMNNIGATGTFDGTVPIHFDSDGNGYIRGGLLISRPPGGNVAYIGELTYEDLGAIANYAFQSLRSLDYNQMAVGLEGSLAGEILTRFQIDGVRQGEGADRNFVTRELAKLPIRFQINIRSENFFALAEIARGYFDPTTFLTTSERSELEVQTIEHAPNFSVGSDPENTGVQESEPDNEPAVQPSESDDLP